MKPRLLAPLLAATSITAASIVPTTPAQAIPVFDASNYAQNLLTAARTLQQINNQIQSLKNEASMLTNMAKHLQRLDFSSLNKLTRSMQAIDALMNQAEDIAFDLALTETALREQFPEVLDTPMTTDQMPAAATAPRQAGKHGSRNAQRSQPQVVENIQENRRAT